MAISMLFLKLLFAHLLGDFVLQTNKWVAQKEKLGWRSPLMYAHALLHGLLTWLLVLKLDFWPCAAAIALSHLLIDIGKAALQQRKPSLSKVWFLADQALHLLVLAVVAQVYTQSPVWAKLAGLQLPWPLLTAYLFITKPASILIKILISHWKPNPLRPDAEAQERQATPSLAEAGMWIGMVERLLVLTFILTRHWEAIGFLLAAKSVFRFGDLRGKHDMQLTEYILIGTLISFGLAILTGLLVA